MAETVYIEGLKELRRLLTPPDELLAEPWKKAMDVLAAKAQEAARAAAPVGQTGVLKARIYAKVQKKPFPLWLAVRSRGVRKSAAYPRGYPYPRLLEYSGKHQHKGWFTSAVQSAWAMADTMLAQAGDEIEKKWVRGR